MIKSILIILLLATSPAMANAAPRPHNRPQMAFSDTNCILAIIGEAEAESYQGKLAVAETIRRRGSLRGVYGINAPRVKKRLYSAATYAEAKRAWAESVNTNVSQGAMGWGNANDIKIFNRQHWFKKCKIVKQIGNHYFWGIK